MIRNCFKRNYVGLVFEKANLSVVDYNVVNLLSLHAIYTKSFCEGRHVTFSSFIWGIIREPVSKFGLSI